MIHSLEPTILFLLVFILYYYEPSVKKIPMAVYLVKVLVLTIVALSFVFDNYRPIMD
jgi:hypothetical protein